MSEEEDLLEDWLYEHLHGRAGRLRETSEWQQEFEGRVAAKNRLGPDQPPRPRDQLSLEEIMRRLATSSTWCTKDIRETKGRFSVRMQRYPDGAIVWLHFYHVVDELYRLVRWDAYDAEWPETRAEPRWGSG